MKIILATIETRGYKSVVNGIGLVPLALWEELSAAIAHLELLRLDGATHVRLNHQHYRSLFEGLAASPQELVRMSTAERSRRADALGAAFINLVMSIRLFLEHTEADLIRRYGRSSPRHLTWKSMVSAKYDRSFAHRFMYRLRNYVAHSGTRGISASIDAAARLDGTFDLRVEHIATPSELLRNWGNWAALQEDLLSRQSIELPEVADEVRALIEEIEYETVMMYRPEITAALETVYRLRNTVSMYQGPLYLIRSGDDYGIEHASLLPVPPMPAEARHYAPGEFPMIQQQELALRMDDSTINIRDGSLVFITKWSNRPG